MTAIAPPEGAGTPSPGARYWHRSLHEYAAMTALAPGGREGTSAEPARFTRFGGLPRHPLPPPARTLGALASAFEPEQLRPAAAGPAPAGRADRAFVSTLLHYACGVLRTEFGPTARWPYHRPTPSARCFAPVEAYYWTPGHDGLPAGVHAYDPAHHALVPLGPGDHRALLGAALGADLDGAVGALILSTVFWRTAFRYGSYAYRLCAQETGLVAGNAMMVAGTLGVRAHLHHQFLDGVLERLVGAPRPQESVAAVLPLYPAGDGSPRPLRRLGAAHTERALSARVPPPAPRPAPAADALGSLEELTGMDGAARLSDTGSFSRLPGGRAAGPWRTFPDRGAELGDCLRRRSSGSPAFNPVSRPVPLDSVLRVLGPVLGPWVSDAVPDAAAPPVALHFWAVNVDGLDGGVYRWGPGGLDRVGPGGAALLGTEAANVNYRAVGGVVFLSGPREAAQEVFGDRGFRVLHQEAGVVAQRVCVLAAAEGLAARIHNGYAAGTLSRALRLPPGHEPLFQIALGVPGPDERYLMPVPAPAAPFRVEAA
ncbi:hypothetical protein AB0F18_13555 [Streptomyces sp. NPDC029216]|uniref:hypothetical protein n=1 Tax=Streptomyces sp. NPDC029216 TaxID=3154701 RepID=UPI0033D7E5ED